MKALLKYPGFEAIFTLVILLLIVIPAMVFAQQGSHNLTIIVNNRDTTVNGKKIADLKPDEKQAALNAFANPGKPPYMAFVPQNNRQLRQPTLRDSAITMRHKMDTIINMPGNRQRQMALGRPGNDSTRTLHYYYTDPRGNQKELVYEENAITRSDIDHMPTVRPDMSHYRMPIMYARDSQEFDFNSVDKNGIPTRENFHVGAALPDMNQKLAGTAVADLNIIDLAFIPEFSTGKTMLIFSLPLTAPAEVSFTDSDSKPIWTEKTSGAKFIKTFALPLNGVYYLVVKQGGKAAVRKVVKE